MDLQCHSAPLPSASCQVAASPAIVPVAKLHGCRTVENVHTMKNHHLPSLVTLKTRSNFKKIASMCQISKLKVAKSLMPSAKLPSARCQAPVPSVLHLDFPVQEISRLIFFNSTLLKPPLSPSLSFQQPLPPLLQPDMFWAFWVFEFHLFHK